MIKPNSKHNTSDHKHTHTISLVEDMLTLDRRYIGYERMYFECSSGTELHYSFGQVKFQNCIIYCRI